MKKYIFKNKKEKAKEYAEKRFNYFSSHLRDEVGRCFLEGVGFAEKWILVSEKLPETRGNVIVDYTIVREDIELEERTWGKGNYYKDGGWFIYDEHFNDKDYKFTVIGWRYLNAK